MPTSTHAPATDLVDRFRAILGAMHPEEATWTAAVWMRFAALSLVPEPGDPHELAHAVRAEAARLKARASWWGTLASPLRFLIASLLRSGGVSAEGFVALVQRDHEALRRVGLHPRAPFHVVASAVRALLSGNHPLSTLEAERIKLLYDGMKGRHWWLTGPEDLPACAMLATHGGAPKDLIAASEQTYSRLLALDFPRGEPLQASAHLLQLSGLPPQVAAERFAAIFHACAERGSDVGSARYEALALLCLLDHEPALVARVHQACSARLGEVRPPLRGPLAFALAADLAFLELVRSPRPASAIDALRAPGDLDDAGRMLAKLRLYQAAAAIIAVDSWHATIATDEVPPPGFWPL